MKCFVVVTGLPGSGKSTVGAAIGEALALSLLDKDEILEALFHALGVGDAQWRRQLSRAADQVLQRLALHSHGAVIASWWRHPLSQRESGTSITWLHSLPGELIEVHCECSPAIAVERFFARKRHAGHLDDLKSKAEELAKFAEAAANGPLGIGRVLQVSTEQPLDLEAILSAVRKAHNNRRILRPM